MKTTHIAVLIGAFTLLTAQLFGQAEAPKSQYSRRIPNIAPGDKPQPEVKLEQRELATANFSDIRLFMPRTLQFTVAGIQYRYDVEGDGAALIALLAELRRTEKITVTIRLPIEPADTTSIYTVGLTLLVGKLK